MKVEIELNSTEKVLVTDDRWPVRIQGSIEIIDGGDVLDSGYTSWLSGAFYITDSEDDLSIVIKEPALKEAGFSEDDLEDDDNEFDVWLSKPNINGDQAVFDIEKIRKRLEE